MGRAITHRCEHISLSVNDIDFSPFSVLYREIKKVLKSKKKAENVSNMIKEIGRREDIIQKGKKNETIRN